MMARVKKFEGYVEDFLGSGLQVPLPTLARDQVRFVAPVKGVDDNVLRYHNYSVIQHAVRRFPFLTAANIDGNHFKNLKRKDVFKGGSDRWRKDPRISYKHQWGAELYSAKRSDFDRGHMTKREDVQWGPTLSHARIGALSTFFYTNSVPQHRALNQLLWRSLEDYILHQEALDHGMKINVFTAPLLMDDDPEFVTTVRGASVLIPRLFWKMVYYTRDRQTLNRVAFLVGQEDILIDAGIVHPPSVSRGDPEDARFQDFKFGDTFQVHPSFIEDLTGFSFPHAREPFEDHRPVRIILEQVDLPLEGQSRTRGGRTRGATKRVTRIKGLTL
ncbi:MAG: DNA/RNA non-specific endonuclease [Rhodothermaceae bacterium]|nr:DNA/RNA non-specific endonuclease [Rhodothermaceae bacterium]